MKKGQVTTVQPLSICQMRSAACMAQTQTELRYTRSHNREIHRHGYLYRVSRDMLSIVRRHSAMHRTTRCYHHQHSNGHHQHNKQESHRKPTGLGCFPKRLCKNPVTLCCTIILRASLLKTRSERQVKANVGVLH